MPNKNKAFRSNMSAEVAFARSLRQVARASGHIVEAHVDGHEIRDPQSLKKALQEYSRVLGPWAKKQSQKMMEAVSKKNKRAYREKSKTIARELSRQVFESDLGAKIDERMNEQIELIKSIPIDAGERAQNLAIGAVLSGKRADEIAEELKNTTGVTESRAMLIARTEVARANATVTQARAEAVGAQSYVWRTTMDGAERPSHRKMNGKVVLYSDPPTLSDGTKGHAGTFPNCRCWQDPILTDD